MLIALIADLHGNRPATEALERDLALTKPEEIWCLGDLVGKGPSNVYTCDWARERCSLIIGGNWDYGLGLRQFPADEYYWNSLADGRLEFLAHLPREKTVTLSGREIRLIHGRPVMEELLTVRSDEERLAPLFVKEDGSRWDVLLYADAHRQAMRTLNPGYLINIGSVGNALGEVHGCYALLDAVPGAEKAPFEIRLRQFEYDREAAARDALESELPGKELFAREVLTGVYRRGQAAAQNRGELG